MFREVQVASEELRSVVEEKQEIKVDCCRFDMLPPPMFNSKYFDHQVINMLTSLRAKELIVYESNNPYDEICEVLALKFMKQALDEECL